MRVGIIGAMEDEVKGLRSKMINIKTLSRCGVILYQGDLNGIDVVLLKCGIGKVSAAVGTTILIEKFSPDYIINTGTAGGMTTELTIGDVVISTDVRYNDVDVTAFGYEFGQLPQMPPGFTPDEKLIEFAEGAAMKTNGIQIKKGLIVSGDSFIHDPALVEEMKSKLPPMLCTEMEAAAIAQVCYMAKVPFLVIRSISDVPGQQAKQSLDDFVIASKNSGALVEKILEKIKEL